MSTPRIQTGTAHSWKNLLRKLALKQAKFTSGIGTKKRKKLKIKKWKNYSIQMKSSKLLMIDQEKILQNLSSKDSLSRQLKSFEIIIIMRVCTLHDLYNLFITK
jgi:hypothetical protein